MNKSRLRYLRNRVVDHIQSMPQKEDVSRPDGGDQAVFDLAYFQITDGQNSSAQEDQATSVPLAEFVNKVTSKYECGFRGCFAGWYALLSQKDGLLTEEDLLTDGLTRFRFDYQNLAGHFGISHNEAKALFASFGGGYELIHVAEVVGMSQEDYNPRVCEKLLNTFEATHKKVLDIRIDLLDRLIDERATGVEKYWG